MQSGTISGTDHGQSGISLTDFYVQGDFGRYCLFVVIPAIPIAFLASYIGKWIRVKQSN